MKWDLEQSDETFLTQSALLACAFHETQIFVHRRFIVTNDGPTPAASFAEASRVICLNAARACGRVLHGLRGHGLGHNIPYTFLLVSKVRFYVTKCAILMGEDPQMPAFMSAMMLYFDIGRERRLGLPMSQQHLWDLEDASKCMNFLEDAEKRYVFAISHPIVSILLTTEIGTSRFISAGKMRYLFSTLGK